MKRTYVNVVADSGAATASLESRESQPNRLLTVDQVASRLQVKPRTVYHWVHEQYIPSIKLGSLIRFDQNSIATWVKKRETVGRISRRLELDVH
jgi:excisionase family DNA binding protein